jgi:uncharacterized protein (TIGR02145 family)
MAKARVLSCALALFALASTVLSGCSDSGQGAFSQTGEETQTDTGINILTSVFPSPKEQNPYSVENMNKAFKNLILTNNADAKDIPELEANFLYVRFLPYGKQGVYELKTYDTSLVLFKHPMDYNEIRRPVVYMDKTLPDSVIPYFASVPVGYEFGTTPYEILQELFLTQPLEEDDGDDQEGSRFVMAKKSNKANKEIAVYLKSQGLAPYQLEIMAFPNSERLNAEIESSSNKVLAKNISVDTDNIVAWSLLPSRWRPSGTLKFQDERKGAQPLVGVRVTAGYSFYWRSSKTDGNGYFQSPERWTFSVDYEANFDNNQFLLQSGHSWYGLYGEDLEIEKNNKKSAWNETFTEDEAKWCVIWTAAYNYWHGEIYGLQRPRQNTWWNHSLEINVYYKNATDYNDALGSYTTGFFVEYIKVLAYGRKHIEIYGTTIHEIAHSSHYDNGKNYSDAPKILKETYTRGIQRYLTLKRYGVWSVSLYDNEYTGLFEDLEDANSTYARTKDGEKTCDKVSGITAPMAEKALFESYSWNGFKDNLMKEYPNGISNGEGRKVTYFAADMDALFKYWETGIGASCPEPIADIRDGKTYRTTMIGTQTWMAENLNYNASGSICYNDNTANCDKYGRLYDWTTAMAVCPSGWHIPSVADWDKLMRYADGTNGTSSPYDSPTAGKHLKTTSGWNGSSGDSNGTDYYGFSALPGGNGYSDGFRNVGSNGDWWSATEYDGTNAYRFDLYHGDKAGWEDASGNRKHDKSNLFSVRCVKD